GRGDGGFRRGIGRAAHARPRCRFARGPLTPQIVDAGAGVSVDDPVGGIFEIQVAQQLNQNGMLEHIGVVACVEGVAITEQGWPLQTWPGAMETTSSVMMALQPQSSSSRARWGSFTVQTARVSPASRTCSTISRVVYRPF